LRPSLRGPKLISAKPVSGNVFAHGPPNGYPKETGVMSDLKDAVPIVRDENGNDVNFGLRIGYGLGVLGLFLLGGLISLNSSSIVPMIAVIILGGVPLSIVVYIMSEGNIQRVHLDSQNRERERDILIKENYVISKNTSDAISELKAKETGDFIIAGAGATIINRAMLHNSMNKVIAQDNNLSEALKTIAGFVEQSKNTDAAEILNEFNKKIDAGDSKVTLKALWISLVSTVPDVVKLGKSAAQIYQYVES
jgi:hypothetical protein